MGRIDLDELERLAKAAEHASRRVRDGRVLTQGEADAAYAEASRFQAAMRPPTALDLIAELRALRAFEPTKAILGELDDALVVTLGPVAAELRAARAERDTHVRVITDLKVSESQARLALGKREAELRAARDVVKAARPYAVPTPQHVLAGDPCGCPPDAHPLASALAAYDKAVAP
jgi:hypothetical protein